MPVTKAGARRKLLIFCVDGGVPGLVAEHDFFALDRRLSAFRSSAVSALPSVYPSSTAPAHASFLTGRHPVGHGIVGNRFFGAETVAEIRERASNPFASVHPYETTSLTCRSLIDRFAERGLSTAAVHFPQTFSRTVGDAGIPSVYCLYAPAADGTAVPGIPGEQPGSAVELTYFQRKVALTFSLTEQGGITVAGAPGAPPVPLERGRTRRLELKLDGVGRLSVPLTVHRADRKQVVFSAGTAVLTMAFGAMADVVEAADTGGGPSSLTVDYTANPEHRFHESPRAPWVKRVALGALERLDPDVLLIRFNQADHAQEFLYWHAMRGDPAERAQAGEQMLDAYRLIDRQIGEIVATVGDAADYLFFSDHGIDYVDTHIALNTVLAELGWDDRMVFQGDSNIAYLYADTGLSEGERLELTETLAALDSTTEVLTRETADVWKLPWGDPRLGELAVTCGPHREFQYGGGAPRQTVRSASHGYFPTAPSMNGFFRMYARDSAAISRPRHLVDVAAAIEKLLVG
ncbi:alkaline phosphatase family protein [Streptomyces sp. NPDC007856]|uniref:alkaline phosphatase family protein n=1 Tax=Streptomyces sp. NPDC007856 TaxID=3364781 RepID=UPI0036C2DA91